MDAAVTSKGQVTIPVEIRRQMNLQPRDRVIFTVLANGTTVMRAKKRSLLDLAGSVERGNEEHVAIERMRPD